MPLTPDHYCIQSERIAKMDKTLGEINDHFQVDGTIGVMSGQLTRLTTLAENGHKEKESGSIQPRLAWWIVAALVAILAAVLGINLPL